MNNNPKTWTLAEIAAFRQEVESFLEQGCSNPRMELEGKYPFFEWVFDTTITSPNDSMIEDVDGSVRPMINRCKRVRDNSYLTSRALISWKINSGTIFATLK